MARATQVLGPKRPDDEAVAEEIQRDASLQKPRMPRQTRGYQQPGDGCNPPEAL
jgi:hypothetical protein